MARATTAVVLLLLVGCAAFAKAAEYEAETEKTKHRKHHGDYHKDGDHERHERMDMALTIQNVTTSITGTTNLAVGATVVYTYNLYNGNNVAGMAVLTGIVAKDPTPTGSSINSDYVINAQLTTMLSAGKYSGATIIAAGLLASNGTILNSAQDILTITGASGSRALRGVAGTIEFSSKIDNSQTITFDFYKRDN